MPSKCSGLHLSAGTAATALGRFTKFDGRLGQIWGNQWVFRIEFSTERHVAGDGQMEDFGCTTIISWGYFMDCTLP